MKSASQKPIPRDLIDLELNTHNIYYVGMLNDTVFYTYKHAVLERIPVSVGTQSGCFLAYCKNLATNGFRINSGVRTL